MWGQGREEGVRCPPVRTGLWARLELILVFTATGNLALTLTLTLIPSLYLALSLSMSFSLLRRFFSRNEEVEIPPTAAEKAVTTLQGYLAHKKQPPHRTLQ